jgi:hypothetical protein
MVAIDRFVLVASTLPASIFKVGSFYLVGLQVIFSFENRFWIDDLGRFQLCSDF